MPALHAPTPRNRDERRHLERLLDYPEAADYLQVPERFVRRLWQTRQLAAIKIGRRVRFDVRDLDAYIEQQRVEAKP